MSYPHPSDVTTWRDTDIDRLAWAMTDWPWYQRRAFWRQASKQERRLMGMPVK